jgi:hypothetical protein
MKPSCDCIQYFVPHEKIDIGYAWTLHVAPEITVWTQGRIVVAPLYCCLCGKPYVEDKP